MNAAGVAGVQLVLFIRGDAFLNLLRVSNKAIHSVCRFQQHRSGFSLHGNKNVIIGFDQMKVIPKLLQNNSQ